MLAQPGGAENDLISVRGKRQTDIHEYELDLIDPLSPHLPFFFSKDLLVVLLSLVPAFFRIFFFVRINITTSSSFCCFWSSGSAWQMSSDR